MQHPALPNSANSGLPTQAESRNDKFLGDDSSMILAASCEHDYRGSVVNGRHSGTSRWHLAQESLSEMRHRSNTLTSPQTRGYAMTTAA